MNFVIFPMFFASSALYPLWKMKEGSLWLYYICLYNPFTWAVELIRFAFYLEVNWQALGIVGGLHRCCSWRCRSGPTIRRSASSSARSAPAAAGRLAQLVEKLAGIAAQEIGVDRIDRGVVALGLRDVDRLDRDHVGRPRRKQHELVGKHDRLAGIVRDQQRGGRPLPATPRAAACATDRRCARRARRTARRAAADRAWWRRRGPAPRGAPGRATVPADSAAACRQCRRPAPDAPDRPR